MEVLEIKVLSTDKDVIEYYKGLEKLESTNSGIDIIFPEDMTITKSCIIPLNIKCQLISPYVHGYYLVPRSSIWKTPLRQANSVGIIDYEYRGVIGAAVDLHFQQSSDNICVENSFQYTVKKRERLFQLVMPNLSPFKIRIVDELTETARGEGGFGSTGK